MNTTVIGIDCASNPANVGLALGTHSPRGTVVQEVRLGSRTRDPVDIIIEWLAGRSGPALLAMDAPLGWPLPLAEALAGHQAGGALAPTAHELFRRETDRFVRQELGKQSLDVGADRIARTAHAALKLLQDVRSRTGLDVPLAWQSVVTDVAAIEVYPAATMVAHRLHSTGYKKSTSRAAREELLHRPSRSPVRTGRFVVMREPGNRRMRGTP
jgi:hypothetical protein